jgi:hypothetical protein
MSSKNIREELHDNGYVIVLLIYTRCRLMISGGSIAG